MCLLHEFEALVSLWHLLCVPESGVLHRIISSQVLWEVLVAAKRICRRIVTMSLPTGIMAVVETFCSRFNDRLESILLYALLRTASVLNLPGISFGWWSGTLTGFSDFVVSILPRFHFVLTGCYRDIPANCCVHHYRVITWLPRVVRLAVVMRVRCAAIINHISEFATIYHLTLKRLRRRWRELLNQVPLMLVFLYIATLRAEKVRFSSQVKVIVDIKVYNWTRHRFSILRRLKANVNICDHNAIYVTDNRRFRGFCKCWRRCMLRWRKLQDFRGLALFNSWWFFFIQQILRLFHRFGGILLNRWT